MIAIKLLRVPGQRPRLNSAVAPHLGKELLIDDSSGSPKVTDLHLVICRQQDVLWLQVTMDNLLQVTRRRQKERGSETLRG